MSAILPNTQLERKQQDYGIIRGEIPTVWMTQISAIGTEDRLKHYNELNDLLILLNMHPANGGDNKISSIENELML
jgi:hypothetical protein